VTKEPDRQILHGEYRPLVWLAAGAFAVAFGAILAWNAHEDYQQGLEEEIHVLEGQARLGDIQIEGALRSIGLVLQSVINDLQDVPALSPQMIDQRQTGLLKQFPEIHYIITFDNRGNVTTAESIDDREELNGVRSFNGSEREYFIAHRDAQPDDYDRVRLSRPFKTVTNRYTIAVSRAIRGPQGQFQGVALVSLSPKYFDTVLRQVLSNRALDAAALHNRYGDIIYRLPAPDKYIGKNIADGDAFKSYLRSDQQLTRYIGVTVTDNVKRILVFSKIGGSELDIGVSGQFDIVMANWCKNALVKLIIFVVVAALSLALAWEAQRRLHSWKSRDMADRRFQAYFERALVGMATIGPQKDWIDVNPALCGILGYSADELTRMPWRQLAYPDDLPSEGAAFERLLSGETDESEIEMRFIHRNNNIVFGNLAVRAVRKADRTVEYFVVALEDITERKRAEAANRHAQAELQATLARLNLVLKTAAEGIIGIDDERRVMFATPAAASILGWSGPEEMVGRAMHDVTGHILADGSSCLDGNCQIRKALDGGDAVRVTEEFFTRADGAILPVEYVVSPLVVSGHVVGVVFVFHDIAERKAMEMELHRSNAELEQFAYVASHDLRQPLRMVSSYLGLIEKSLDPRLLPDDVKKFIGFAVGGAKRMDSLILDLLDYSRVGKAAESVPVALSDAVADALANLKVAIQEADAEIVCVGSLPTVKGDLTDLTRLFQNLIGNAVKYRHPDRRPKIVIACERRGKWWQISIQDNGIGIAPADQERAFVIFQRLVPKDAYEGTGIGLAVCKKVVEHHGGRIWIDSVLGEGSTFFMTFPVPTNPKANV